MKTINRDKIQRMIGNVGGNGGNGSSSADLAGYATQMWVEQNYISKEFFNTLFTIHGHDADDTNVPPTDVIIEPNDTETVLDSIEAMVGLWTEKYLSALGLSSGGGGGGDVLAEPLVSINGIGSPTAANQTLVWNGTQWTFQPYGQGGGSVTSIRITVPTGFAVTPSTITTAGTFAISFASGYSLPTTAKQTNWDTAYTWVNTNGQTVLSNSHSHSNKTVLDGITSTKVSNWDTAYTWVNANGASTVEKTAWGKKYWLAGAPASIDGDMTSVGDISFSASGKNIGGVAYFDTTNSRLGIGTASPSTSLHVVGRVTCEYDSTKKGSFSNVRGEYLTNYGINSSGFTIITTGQSSSSNSTVRISMTPYNAPEQYILFGASSSIKMGTTISNNTETYRDGAYIQIGGARIVWDNANTALKVVKSDGTSAANFYATGAVSALGSGSGGGGGASDYIPISGSSSITGSLTPATRNTYDLGSSTKAWNTLYVNRISGNASLSVQGVSCTTFSTSASAVISSGAKFASICVESDSSGRVSSSRVGEINRYNGTLHLQYDSGTANVTMCRQGFVFSTYTDGGGNNLSVISTNNRSLRIELGSASLNPYISKPWNEGSDIRLKNIVKTIGDFDIQEIANAPVFDFTYKNDDAKIINLGTSAQYWQKVMPSAVKEMGDGYLSMNYGGTALAAAVLTARKVVNHEERIKALEAENERLRNEIEQLKVA